MAGSTRYSPELRERAVRLVIENRQDYPSEWATFTAVSKLFGMSVKTVSKTNIFDRPTSWLRLLVQCGSSTSSQVHCDIQEGVIG
jgi:hypothetical protein